MHHPIKTIYLAGPITGLSYEDARNGWRKEFAGLVPGHIRCLSPMRKKDFLIDQGLLRGDPEMYPNHLMATASGIVTRDHNDVRTCDAVVANFLGAEKASVGTCIEFGWAHAYGKPVVMIIEAEGELTTGPERTVAKNPHWHAMLHQIAGYVTPSIEEAAHVVTHLLTPGV